MRIATIVVVLWLVIGAIAGAQRGYYSSAKTNCAHAGTIAFTVVVGPLNYFGMNPKVHHCNTPQPSK